MKLSDLKCRKAKADGKLIKLSDGDGLFVHVYPNGKKLWRLSYRHGGKQRDLAFGPYPHISLLEARKQREAARDLLRANKDPGAVRQREIEAEAEREETTFAAFADVYLDRLNKTGRSEPTINKARWIVEDLARDLRSTQVSNITPRDVLRALRAVEAKGNRETARRMRGVLSAVFRLAVIEGVIDVDPTSALQGALLPPVTKHHPAVTRRLRLHQHGTVQSRFRGDTTDADAAFLRDSQVPINMAIFSERLTQAARRSKPSWAIVATQDRAIDPRLLRQQAERIGAEITEVEASHVPFLTQPRAVADVIDRAARSVIASTPDRPRLAPPAYPAAGESNA